MQSLPKPQFASWLIEQVGTGHYTGLCYVERNKFRVPWKHNSRKDCNDEDGKIFRAWAVASGKINEFPKDKARWKTNFRCALNNLSNFKLIQDNSKNSDDPHKIYEIINTECNYASLLPQDFQEDSDMPVDIQNSPIECLTVGNELNLLHSFVALGFGNSQSEEQPWAENYGQPNLAVVENCHIAADDIQQPLPDQPSYYEVNLPPALEPPVQPSINDLEVSIHYRKKEMLKLRFNAARLQLHYHHWVPELNAEQLCFPSAENLLDQKQVEYTTRILNNIQRGLLLEVQDTGIYAYRQDRCHVFASTSDPSVAHPDPKKLPQNSMVQLLSFEKFVNELKQFKDNNGSSPEYTINMCFGEKFPDGRPLEKKLIVVKVVPLICRHFHEMAQMEGASSLHSANVSLQISHNSLYDLIHNVFGVPGAEDPAQAATPFIPTI
ncbi:interferon regulatory factor 7 isoform X2 [Halichoeres trimaculatus]|uniref:interferon regulatory factor 7 isoform X2 n=1 Tax=Halichoeres trimaculatus TaxID=147232 RepID=UPI003D9E618F